MKKKWFGMVIALALCLGLCPIGVFATEGEPDEANVPAPIDEPTEGAVAQVEIDGSITGYNTIEEAWTAANGNTATITLLADVTANDTLTVPNDSSITFDGGDHTLTSGQQIAIQVNGTFKLVSGTIKSTYSNLNARGIIVNGTLEMTGGAVTTSNSRTSGSRAVHTDSNSSITISGGKIFGVRGISTAGGTVTIQNGEISGSTAAVDINGGTVTIEGGTFTSSGSYGMNIESGTVVLRGGTFTGGSYAVNSQNDVSDLLNTTKPYVYFDANGQPVALEDGQTTLPEGTYTVGECTHPEVLKDLGNGTHGGECPYCGTEIAAAPHTLGADKKCEGCKAELRVQVQIGNATTYYGGIGPAWTAVQGKTATVTLLANVTASSSLTVSSGNITFDGGEFTLTGPSNNNKIIDISGGKLTVTGGTLKSGENTSWPQSFDISISGGELVVTGGSLEAGTGCVGLSVGPNASVKLSGGTFSGGQSAIVDADSGSGNVGRFLLNYDSTNAAEKHYAYYQGGQPVNLISLDAPSRLTGTVTVGECEHKGVTPTPNNNGTHSLNCPYCGYTETAADCTYGTECKHDDANHWLTCTVCGYENKEAHNWEFDSKQSGNVIENYWVCFGCGRTKDHLTLTITVPTGLTYGNTEGKQVTCTVSPETTCDKVRWRFTGGSWPEFADGVLPANLPVGEHWFRVEGLMSDDTIVFSGSYYITVAPKPLTVTGVTAASRDYDGTNEVAITAVALDGVVAGDTVSVDLTGLKGTIPGPDAGTYTSVTLPKTLKLTGAAAGNYTLTQPTGALAASVTIAKTEWPGNTYVGSYANPGGSGTVDLSSLIPSDAKLGEPYLADQLVSESVFKKMPAVSGKSVSYTLSEDAEGQLQFNVPVTALTNYHDFEISIIVNVTDKEIPVLSVSPITRIYDGNPVPNSAIKGTATVNGVAVKGEWMLVDYDDSLTQVKDSGAKFVRFIPEDTEKYQVVGTYITVTINKATPSGTPTYTAISTSGKTLTDAALTAPAGWPAGTLTWELPGTTEVAANTAYRWTFTPNNANYNTLSGSITLWQRSTGGGSGSGGSSGGGGGSSGTSLSVTTTGQNSSYLTTTTTATPTASTRGGKAAATVDTAMGNEIVKQAVANKSETVVIAPKVTGSVIRTEVSIPAATVWQIRSQTNASLTIATPVANVTIPNGGLGSLSGTSGIVTVTAEKTGNIVELSVTVGGRIVTSIPGGLTLTVPVSYTTPGTVAVLIHNNGTREVVRKSVADNGSMTIPLNGSAKLEIVDNSRYFYDVPATSWAADAVAFASAHELFNGTGANQFSPNRPMSRGMLATVLHNLESNPYQPITGVFADVDNGAWYAEGVAWATANGIVNGYGRGQFGPNDNITREQLAVMLWRYAGSPAAVNRELRFADAYKASDWALEALRWATECGVINGKDNGILDPRGYATRAETAQMLKNFMERR
ncbi:MAG: S-layer homology domain-containing protein [Oscillospiraceae bacterium]|nr:S-layer homology domain-containing protein [Oscillospiraceae bacterium]